MHRACIFAAFFHQRISLDLLNFTAGDTLAEES